ncbi:hypothetical protein [Bradyrhizobium sp. AZCC 2176]|uniref:hypothetical protein n=1 Tax=Bradyrhizobium sp. AZCC 2176 TaxID=3117025 RepID=UPI002FF0E105
MRRSIRILSCPVFLPGPHFPRLPDVFSERTIGTKVEDNLGPEIRKLYRWTRPCFCLRHPMVPPIDGANPNSTPLLDRLSHSARFSAPDRRRFRADERSIRASTG